MTPTDEVTLTVWETTDPGEGDACSSVVMTHFQALNTIIGLLADGNRSGILETTEDEALMMWNGNSVSGRRDHMELITAVAVIAPHRERLA